MPPMRGSPHIEAPSTSFVCHYIRPSPPNPPKCTPNSPITSIRRLDNSPGPGLAPPPSHSRLASRELAPAPTINSPNSPNIFPRRNPQSNKRKLFLPISLGPRFSIHGILTRPLPNRPLSTLPLPWSSHGTLRRQCRLSPRTTRGLPHPIRRSS
jgi:hypothetical protein